MRFGVRRLVAAFRGVGLPPPSKQPFRSGVLLSSYEMPLCRLEAKSLRQAAGKQSAGKPAHSKKGVTNVQFPLHGKRPAGAQEEFLNPLNASWIYIV